MKINTRNFKESVPPSKEFQIVEDIRTMVTKNMLYGLQLLKGKKSNEYVLTISNPKDMSFDEMRNKFLKEFEDKYPEIHVVDGCPKCGMIKFLIEN